MLKAVIVDDEPRSMNALHLLLQQVAKEKVVLSGTATSVAEGKKLIDETRPDIVFLDVNMPHEGGFGLLNQLREIDFELVFVTAYSEYALQAFEHSALSYLLKPVNPSHLEKVIDRAIRNRANSQIANRIDMFEQRLTASKMGKVAIASSRGYCFLPIKQIIYCESSGSYTNIYLEDGKRETATRLLKDFEMMLYDQGFFRIHHSYLINLEHLKFYTSGYVELAKQIKLPVSSRKREAFVERLKRL